MPKKTVAKKAKVSSRKTPAKKSTRQVHPLHQTFLMAEQEEFHRNHPNANFLIAAFLTSVFVLAVVYLSKMY